MSIENEVREYEENVVRERLENDELVDYLLLLIQTEKEKSVKREQVSSSVRKMLTQTKELKRKGYKLHPGNDLIRDVPIVEDICMRLEADLYFEEQTRKKGDYKKSIAKKVAEIMYVHGHKPTATDNGDYEVVLEWVLRAVSDGAGNIHKYALDALKEVNSYMSSVTGS